MSAAGDSGDGDDDDVDVDVDDDNDEWWPRDNAVSSYRRDGASRRRKTQSRLRIRF